jgi:lysophospholipase L1-like esterase
MNHAFLCVVGIFLMSLVAFAQNSVRVACVGDSITYGDKLADRATQSYPAVLERLSQGRFTTGNFGVNGATALKILFRTWTDTPACRDALAFKPGCVVIMLGINDLAFPDLLGQYSAALRNIVTRFQTLPSTPRIFLCTLTPIAPEDRQAQANQAIRSTMIPAIRAIAAQTGATLIDIHAAFLNRIELLPDGIHPSPEGAELIARTVLAALENAPAELPQIRPAPVAGPVDISIRNETRAAQDRAARWMGIQVPPRDLPDPLARLEGRELHSPEDVADLLPLLEENPAKAGTDSYFSYAALALALNRIGHETVFLADGRPVVWREALLHQLVQRQQVDARGNGFWSNPDAEDKAADSVRSTAYALQAIAATLGK